MRLALPVLVSSAIGAVAILVLRGMQPDAAPSTEPPVDYSRAFAALCEASDLAGASDLRRAHGIFLSRAHVALHELAAELSEVDRSSAARLLEAKASVEATLPLDDPTAARALDDLVAATATAIQTVTDAPLPTCEETRP